MKLCFEHAIRSGHMSSRYDLYVFSATARRNVKTNFGANFLRLGFWDEVVKGCIAT